MRPLLSEAREEDARNDPAHARHPYFHPVTVLTDSGRKVSAFSRDLSVRGIGLMHEQSLPLDEVEITISTGRGYCVKVRTKMTWCKPCGDGFYLSGGVFASVPIFDEN